MLAARGSRPHLPGVAPEDLAGDIHAGLVETSRLLAIAPDLIDPEYEASAELGEGILDVLGGRAAEAVAELLDGRLAIEECHSTRMEAASLVRQRDRDSPFGLDPRHSENSCMIEPSHASDAVASRGRKGVT